MHLLSAASLQMYYQKFQELTEAVTRAAGGKSGGGGGADGGGGGGGGGGGLDDLVGKLQFFTQVGVDRQVLGLARSLVLWQSCGTVRYWSRTDKSCSA